MKFKHKHKNVKLYNYVEDKVYLIENTSELKKIAPHLSINNAYNMLNGKADCWGDFCLFRRRKRVLAKKNAKLKVRNINFYDWKKDKDVFVRKMSDLTDYGVKKYDLFHYYYVKDGDRLYHKNLCLKKEVSKKHKIVFPDGRTREISNWIKVAKKYKINTKSFKKMLNKELIIVRGFYLKEMEHKVPMKTTLTGVLEKKDGGKTETVSAEKLVKNLTEKCPEKIVKNLIRGKTVKSRSGYKLKKVIEIKRPYDVK
jgi:hypothetical protein